MSDRVLVNQSDGIMTVTLNRPEKRNALDREMIDALHEQIDRADLDPSVNVLALRGTAPDFCAGADLAELLDSVGKGANENANDAAYLGAVFEKLRVMPKVTVAIVYGRALAGGCGLATACDIVVAHEEATFGYPEIKRGFVPAMVMAMLRRAVGEKIAFDLVATGRPMPAREALALGLISRVFEAEAFEEDVSGLLLRLSRSSASALSFIKRQLYELDGRSFSDAIALGAQVNATVRSTPDFAAAVSRFLKKE